MTNELIIDKLSQLLEKSRVREKELKEQNLALKKQILKMRTFGRQYSRDSWYIAYLQSDIFALERHIENQDNIISQYQAHYAKYGKFYTEYQEKQESA